MTIDDEDIQINNNDSYEDNDDDVINTMKYQVLSLIPTNGGMCLCLT